MNYPREILDSDAHAEDRAFGLFEVIHIFVALVILIASIFLYRRSTASSRFVLFADDAKLANVEFSFTHRGAWIAPLLLIVIILFLTGGIPAASSGVLESSFQRDCEKANIMDVWHESVPERDGQATADFALPGCTTGIGLGQYHFADAREFAYFDRPAQARAQLATNPSTLAPNIPVILTFTLRDYQGNPVQDFGPGPQPDRSCGHCQQRLLGFCTYSRGRYRADKS